MLENRLVVSYKAKHTFILLSSSTLRCLHVRNGNLHLIQSLVINAHINHNNPQWK